MKVRPLVEALCASVIVTGLVTAASMFLPDKHVATAVGVVFLAATWILVWRRDDATVVRAGLSFGGTVLPGPLDIGRALRASSAAVLWALGFAAVTFVPFFFGWRHWWKPHLHFSLAVSPMTGLSELLGQLVIIALPEEAFYRGYLQSRLDDVFTRRVRIAGAEVGLGLIVSSLVFALGHLATIHDPTRLAVFFPALLFGWLRARTGGVGAGIVFHALCNVFSEMLGRAYGVY